jgi:WD40 repeat protein
VDRRSPLEDPLFALGKPDALSASGKELPEALAPHLEALRRRIRETYDAHLLGRVQAILAACRAWKAEVVVFPEYSIPWEILGGVAEAAGEMVVVAGTHTVEPAAKRSGIYERLALPPEAMPALGLSIAPVLHRGRLLGLSAKLNASQHEPQMKPGDAWAPIEMPGGIPGPMGILVCLDFLYRESTAHRALVAEAMEQCRFLAVPSLTPSYTLPEFAGKAWEEARRYGRPVLYCDGTEGGGTAIYVDEGRPTDLRRFPEHAGLLEAGDEGVIVADVDLGYERPGRSTRYAGSHPVFPVAAATLVYLANPTAEKYARWLEEAGPLLSRDDDDAVETLVERVRTGRDVLLNAGALSGGAARGRRLSRLVREIEKVTSVNEIRQLTRDVVVPAGVLPLAALRAAMAKGAADAVFAWMKERRGGGLDEVERRLREAGEVVKAGDAGSWTREGATAIEAAALGVRGESEEDAKAVPVEVPVRVVLPKGIDPAALGEQTAGAFRFNFQREASYFQLPAFRIVPLDGRSSQLDPEPFLRPMMEIWAAEGLSLLAVAEGATQVASIGVVPADGSGGGAVLVISSCRDGWTLWTGNVGTWAVTHRVAIHDALAGLGFNVTMIEHLTTREQCDRIAHFLSCIRGAREAIEGLRTQRLQEVNGRFEEPFARVNGGERRPVLAVLDEWILSTDQTALLLGEFGSGKSTALAVWAARQWQQESGPRPILVNLAGASPTRDAEGLLLDAAGAQDTPANRAALRLFVRYRFVVPCFDGFDEIATRLGAADLAGRLSALLEIARGGSGQVLVSCRNNYFQTDAQLNATTERALVQALGSTDRMWRIEVDLFDARQVEELVRKVCETPEEAEKALGQIAQTYDLQDLVKRPLLLGMVLATLDRLEPAAAVGTADLYEAYMRRWLDQTRLGDPECFSDEQKIEFAEALADQLWRSGQPSCTWQELQASVRARLARHLPDDIPPAAAFQEIQGGAFFAHEGEDRYRFAHKSFLEYFLARGLVRTLPERPADVLATRPITREVAAFVGEVLRREGNPKQSRAVQAVRESLKGSRVEYEAGAHELERIAPVAANALRLLLGLSRWSKDRDGWIPEKADLRRVELAGEDLQSAMLVGARLEHANLAGADLTATNLTWVNLSRARFSGVTLDAAILRYVVANGTDFVQAEANGAIIEGSIFDEAQLQQSTWTDCSWDGTRAQGAIVTACAIWGRGKVLEGAPQLTAMPPSGQASLTTGHRDVVYSVACHPDSKRIASAGADGTVRLWDAATGKELMRIQGHARWVFAVAWHPTGKVLASAGDDGSIRLWDPATGKELARLTRNKKWIRTVAWHPAGKHLASGGSDSIVRLWDASTGQQFARLEGHTKGVNAVAWHPEGKLLASAGHDHSVRLWDAAARAECARFEIYKKPVWAMAWHPAGKLLAIAGDDPFVWLLDVTVGKEFARLEGHTDGVRAVAWHPEGKHLASAGNDSTVRLWDTINRKELLRMEGHVTGVIDMAWHPDGERIVSAGQDSTIRHWSAITGREIVRSDGHMKVVNAAAWHPDGTQFCTTGADRVLRLWNAVTGEQIARLDGHTNSVNAVAWHPHGKCLASAGADHTVYIWDAATGKQLTRLDGHERGVTGVDWHPDGKRIASVGGDAIVRVWSAATGKEIVQLRGHTGSATAVAWRPDGKWLASAGTDMTVRLWDATNGKEIARLTEHAGWVNTVKWHSDGKQLASAGRDGTIVLWNAPTGRVLAKLGGHMQWVRAVDWHPNGKCLASAGDDKAVLLWNTATGQEIARLKGHSDKVKAVAWHPSGELLTSAGDDGTIRLWRAFPPALLATFEMAGQTSLARTPGGFCLFDDAEPQRVRLALRRPESATVLYLPLAGLRDVLHRPDKVKAALAGDLAGDDLGAVLDRLGRSGGVAWDGKSHRIALQVASCPTPEAVPPVGERVAMSQAHPPRERLRAPMPVPFADIVSVSSSPTGPPDVPADMLNPFRPGPALADAAALPPGREPIVNRLLDLLRRGMPTVLRGHRRSGKTSILRHLAHRHAPSARYVTLEGRRVKTAVDLARILNPSLRGDDAADVLRDHLRAEAGAILLLDEIGHLRDAEPDLFAWIRAVGQDGTGIVLSGSPWDWTQVVRHAASAPGSSFSNDVTPVDLGPLAEADAIEFLVETAALAGVPIEPDKTARWTVARCGTWPFYLQVMGDAVVGAVLEGNRRALVEAQGVTDLYEQSLFAAHDGSFQVRWEELPGAAQAIVHAIRDPIKLVYKDLGREEQKILRDTGLCDSRGQWIDDRPFFEWIQRTVARSTKPPPPGGGPESKENKMTPRLPKLLIDAYQKGKLALFIGSGLSRGADVKGDFPGWKDLPERLLAACTKYGVRDDKWIEKKRDLFQGRMRLEEMLAELGALRAALDRDYQAALHDIFNPTDAAPGAAHRAVAALGVPAVLTTNYDQLLEASDPLPGRQPYTWRHADRALSALRGGRKVLLKVHGSVEDHESIVMSDREYETARSNASYQAVLRFLLQDSTFLFVGYGMNDPLDLDLAFKANADAFRTSAQKHFVLLRNPSDADADRYHREYRVEGIAYSDHDDVTTFLDALARAKSSGP